MSVKYSGQFPLTESWTILVVLKSINCGMFNIDKSVNNLLRSADSDSLLISGMALFWRRCSFSMRGEPQFPQTTLK